MTAEIGTERLIMRGWRESDLAPWAAMNADPEVRRYLGPLLTFEQASAWVLNFQDDLDRYGFGFWAVEVRASGEFIGFTGLGIRGRRDAVHRQRRARPGGWPGPAWGHGYATEAALAALEYGFGPLGLPEIVAVTMAGNLRSRAVMRRIGMTSDPGRGLRRPGRGGGPAPSACGLPETPGSGRERPDVRPEPGVEPGGDPCGRGAACGSLDEAVESGAQQASRTATNTATSSSSVGTEVLVLRPRHAGVDLDQRRVQAGTRSS